MMKAIYIKQEIMGGMLVYNQISVVNIEPKLEAYYHAIGTDCVDIQMREIGGKAYDVICDDEIFLKGNPCGISLQSQTDQNYNLRGSLIICNQKRGREVSLSEDDIKSIISNFKGGVLLCK